MSAIGTEMPVLARDIGQWDGEYLHVRRTLIREHRV